MVMPCALGPVELSLIQVQVVGFCWKEVLMSQVGLAVLAHGLGPKLRNNFSPLMLYIVQHMKCILNSQPKCFFHLINLKMSSHVLLWLLWMLICICHFLLNMFFLSFHGLLWMLWLPICMIHSTLTLSIAPLTQFWCCSQTLKGRRIFLFKGFF